MLDIINSISFISMKPLSATTGPVLGFFPCLQVQEASLPGDSILFWPRTAFFHPSLGRPGFCHPQGTANKKEDWKYRFLKG
jgi:hypothetical protein